MSEPIGGPSEPIPTPEPFSASMGPTESLDAFIDRLKQAPQPGDTNFNPLLLLSGTGSSTTTEEQLTSALDFLRAITEGKQTWKEVNIDEKLIDTSFNTQAMLENTLNIITYTDLFNEVQAQYEQDLANVQAENAQRDSYNDQVSTFNTFIADHTFPLTEEEETELQAIINELNARGSLLDPPISPITLQEVLDNPTAISSVDLLPLPNFHADYFLPLLESDFNTIFSLIPFSEEQTDLEEELLTPVTTTTGTTKRIAVGLGSSISTAIGVLGLNTNDIDKVLSAVFLDNILTRLNIIQTFRPDDLLRILSIGIFKQVAITATKQTLQLIAAISSPTRGPEESVFRITFSALFLQRALQFIQADGAKIAAQKLLERQQEQIGDLTPEGRAQLETALTGILELGILRTATAQLGAAVGIPELSERLAAPLFIDRAKVPIPPEITKIPEEIVPAIIESILAETKLEIDVPAAEALITETLVAIFAIERETLIPIVEEGKEAITEYVVTTFKEKVSSLETPSDRREDLGLISLILNNSELFIDRQKQPQEIQEDIRKVEDSFRDFQVENESLEKLFRQWMDPGKVLIGIMYQNWGGPRDFTAEPPIGV